MEPIVCIVNPHAAGGRTARQWTTLGRALDRAGLAHDVRFTRGPGDAATLAAEAIAEGARTIVAVGGDGTIHEVVNGFFDGDAPRAPEARLGILPAGSGSDLIKTLGIPADVEGAVAVIARGQEARIDLGRATYRSHVGVEERRYFINTASAGVSGAALQAMRHLPAFLPGTAAYMIGAVQTLFTFAPFEAEVRLDGTPLPAERALMLVVGNGRYFGSGMHVLPSARMDDGLLDLLLFKERPLWELLFQFPRLYAGTHMDLPIVSHATTRRLSIGGKRALPVELDGEQPGTTPLEIEVVPGAIRVIV